MNLPTLLLLHPLLSPPLGPSVLPPHLRPPQLPLSRRRPPAASDDASAAHIFCLYDSDHSAPPLLPLLQPRRPPLPPRPLRHPPPSPFPSRPHHPRPLRRRRAFARIGHGRALIVGVEACREAIRSFGERIGVPALGFAALWARAVGGRLQDCIFGWVSKVSIGVIAGCVTGIFRAPAGKMVLCWYQRLHSTGFGVLFVGVAFLGSPCFGSFVDWVGGGARWFSGGL